MKKGLDYLIADEIAGTAGALRSRMIAERLAIKTQDGTLGKPTNEPQDKELADMRIHVGDDTYYYPAEPMKQKQSPVWPLVAAAALAAGGLGTAGGMYMTRPSTKAIEQAVKVGGELPEYSLKISNPNSKKTDVSK